MSFTRRTFLETCAALVATSGAGPSALAQAGPTVSQPEDRVFICNEDSNTLSVIDPRTNAVETAVNLTSFDEDPRPPFRFVTGGTIPTHAAMIHKPLYHGAIAIHGAAPSPDNTLIATTGRGSSNVYLIDTRTKSVIGNSPNLQARDDTNKELLSSGVLVGREPHEPTFTRNGKELWVTVRGEGRIAIVDVAEAREGRPGAVRLYLPTLNGPAQVWFSADGDTAFVVSQKASDVDLFALDRDGQGFSRPRKLQTVDITAQDPFGFTPFLKTSPDGAEVWLSHKLADAISALEAKEPFRVIETVPLGQMPRPNHVEFVENPRGKVVYASLARVDDGGPGGVASSRIAVIDRSVPAGQRKVVGQFFSHGREAHGLWVNPENSLLYVAHEQDELPNTPNGGQTVCSAFDVSDPFNPHHVAQIPLGELALPSGKLRNKKSINLVYVRPGARSQTA
jgi:YVTN family beta-propeller protein